MAGPTAIPVDHQSTAVPGSAQHILDTSPLSRAQIIAVAVLMGVNGLDGFDAFAINFASPGLAAEWGVEKDTLGFVKSMNLIGMGLGSLFIAPFADRFGRKPIILICTAVLAISMLACAFVDTVFAMSAWRIITGLGIGAMLASITAMAAETSNAKYRALCVSISATGYLIGAVLGGLVSAELLERYDWRSIFIFGGVISALFVPLVAWKVSETIPFLAARNRAGDLERANAILSEMNHEAARDFGTAQTDRRFSLVKLFSGSMAMVTLTVTFAYFFQVITFYYFVGWVPDILVDLGYTQADAARVLTAANLGGVAGALTIGWLTSRIGLVVPTFTAAFMGAVAVYFFGAAGQAGFGLYLLIGLAAGYFLNATIVMMYALMARAFPAEIRAMGAGFVLGFGRLGGVCGPIIGGFLFQAGFGVGLVSLIMGLGAVGCAVMVLFIAPALRRQEGHAH